VRGVLWLVLLALGCGVYGEPLRHPPVAGGGAGASSAGEAPAEPGTEAPAEPGEEAPSAPEERR
jgi:hypothetical protein